MGPICAHKRQLHKDKSIIMNINSLIYKYWCTPNAQEKKHKNSNKTKHNLKNETNEQRVTSDKGLV